MAKLRRIWVVILSSIISGLGFSACEGPDMYGPAPIDGSSSMLMYGPAPMTKFDSKAGANAPDVQDTESNDHGAEIQAGE